MCNNQGAGDNLPPHNFMLGKWDGFHVEVRRFGADDATYLKAAEWLEGFGLVEDWGCGCIWAKQFFKQYRGVDGSGPFCDIRADLTEYSSKVPCILIRHVLEHNHEWRVVLRNLLQSFGKRACIVLSLPLEDKERVWTWERDIPYIHLEHADFESAIAPFLKGYEVINGESVYYLER